MPGQIVNYGSSIFIDIAGEKCERYVYSDGDGTYTCRTARGNEPHRLDGPAINWKGSQAWYFRGKYIPVSNQKDFERYLKLKAFWI